MVLQFIMAIVLAVIITAGLATLALLTLIGGATLLVAAGIAILATIILMTIAVVVVMARSSRRRDPTVRA